MAYAWESSYPPGLPWSLPITPTNPVQNFLRRSAEKWPDRAALDFYGYSVNFAELDELVRRAAKGLQVRGVGVGSHVGLHLENSPHYIICFFATLCVGGTVVNFNPTASSNEFGSQLLDSDVTLIVTGDWQGEFEAARRLSSENGVRLVGCTLRDFLPAEIASGLVDRAVRAWSPATNESRFTDLIASDVLPDLEIVDQQENDIAVLQYTGGTTGEPKGAMLTHRNFFSVVDMLLRFTGGAFEQRQFTLLCVLPLWHVFGLTFMLLRSIASGTRIVLHLRFDAGRVLADISSKQVNAFSGVPAMYAAIAGHSRFMTEDLSSVLSWSSGGAPFPPDLRARFEQRARVDIHEGYALTETAGIAVQAMTADRLEPFCVGLPVPNTIIEIVDLETGMTVLPIGEVGEICISGPQVMKGYWRRPEQNATAFRGGRFHTGDVGRLDERGFLTLLDRIKDMILVGGHCVYPRTIERALIEHPSVQDAAVIGVPSADFGEVGHAYLVLQPGQVEPSRKELYAFLAQRLTSHEIPLSFEAIAELPNTGVGKVKKRELAERFMKNGQMPAK